MSEPKPVSNILFAPTLFQKSIFAALSILILECGFFACQIYLVKEAEKEANKQESVRQIIAAAHGLMQNLYMAGDGVTKYGFKHQREELVRYEEAREKIPKMLAGIKASLKEQPKQAILFAEIEKQIDKGMERIAQFKRTIETEEPAAVAKLGLQHQAAMQGLLEGLVKDLMEFLEQEKTIESRSPAILEARRNETKMLLAVGLTGNLLLALSMILVFTSGITSRIKVLVDNSESLQFGKRLANPISGGDEIAALDEAIHEMAEALEYEERMVREAEEEFRTIIEQLPVGLLILSADQASGNRGGHEIDYANQKAESIFDLDSGFAASQKGNSPGLVGRPLSSVLTDLPEDLEDLSQVSKRLFSANTFADPPRTISLELSLVALKLRGRNCYLGIFEDVTQAVELENMKQAFVAMVSHDLRTPLTSVIGFLQLLPAGVYGPVEERAVTESKQAEKRADHLIGLINDLLDLEKLNAGQLEMFKQDNSLEDILDSVIDNLADLCEEQGVNIIFEGCQARLNADSERLVQAFGKLVGCFVSLARRGQITILVQGRSPLTIKLLAPERLLAPNRCQHFFEPFQNIDESNRVAPGLSLALARALLTANGAEATLRVDRSATELSVVFS